MLFVLAQFLILLHLLVQLLFVAEESISAGGHVLPLLELLLSDPVDSHKVLLTFYTLCRLQAPIIVSKLPSALDM